MIQVLGGQLPGGLRLDVQGGYGADAGGLGLGLSLGMASEGRGDPVR